ncbi:polynucleotide adenylyltransferase [Sarracenia purpurea var. burkii]
MVSFSGRIIQWKDPSYTGGRENPEDMPDDETRTIALELLFALEGIFRLNLSVRSAFAMAFSTLTNTKTILGLGPNRSILGTIIRPDPVLLERRGSNGEVTFSNLLPGAGEPLQANYDDQQGLFCNWQLGEEEEEPFPRENAIADCVNTPSSGKKRKAVKEGKKLAKKKKENGGPGRVRHEESGSRKESGKKKKRWRHNGFSRSAGSSPWSRSS